MAKDNRLKVTGKIFYINNVKKFDLFLSAVGSVNLFLLRCLDGMKLVKNWLAVSLFIAGFKKNVLMKFRDGFEIKLNNNRDFYSFWKTKEGIKQRLSLCSFQKIKLDENSQIITIDATGITSPRFHYAETKDIFDIIRSINSFFEKGKYCGIYVKDRVVIDIGAYIGDTQIYFACNGARHIYAFEPFPHSFEIAKINIKLNNKISDKITLLNAGVGKESKILEINSEYVSDVDSSINSSINLLSSSNNNTNKINIITLEEIINRYNLDNQPCILKMNCEGCEYEIILNTPDYILKVFEQIIIGYHYGYINIKNKLQSIGFKVKILPNHLDIRRGMIRGLLVAQKQIINSIRCLKPKVI